MFWIRFGFLFLLSMQISSEICCKELTEISNHEKNEIEYIKKEINFSEWETKTREGSRVVSSKGFDAKVLVPPNVEYSSNKIEGPIPTYHIKYVRTDDAGMSEQINLLVRIFPSVQEAHEGMLRYFLQVSAPLSYLKENWESEKENYGDVNFGVDLWSKGNVVFELIDGNANKKTIQDIYKYVEESFSKLPGK